MFVCFGLCSRVLGSACLFLIDALVVIMSERESSENAEPEQVQCKRKVQLTAKALANIVEQLQKERK